MKIDIKTLSRAMRRNMLAMHTSQDWLMVGEMAGNRLSGMALTLLSINSAWIERRWVSWGGETGKKRGDGYEYRMTDAGRAARAELEAVRRKV